jgi:hypothetical protein
MAKIPNLLVPTWGFLKWNGCSVGIEQISPQGLGALNLILLADEDHATQDQAQDNSTSADANEKSFEGRSDCHQVI